MDKAYTYYTKLIPFITSNIHTPSLVQDQSVFMETSGMPDKKDMGVDPSE